MIVLLHTLGNVWLINTFSNHELMINGKRVKHSLRFLCNENVVPEITKDRADYYVPVDMADEFSGR